MAYPSLRKHWILLLLLPPLTFCYLIKLVTRRVDRHRVIDALELRTCIHDKSMNWTQDSRREILIGKIRKIGQILISYCLYCNLPLANRILGLFSRQRPEVLHVLLIPHSALIKGIFDCSWNCRDYFGCLSTDVVVRRFSVKPAMPPIYVSTRSSPGLSQKMIKKANKDALVTRNSELKLERKGWKTTMSKYSIKLL